MSVWASELVYKQPKARAGQPLPGASKLDFVTSVYRQFAKSHFEFKKRSGDIDEYIVFDDFCKSVRLQFPGLIDQLKGEEVESRANGVTRVSHAQKSLPCCTLWTMLKHAELKASSLSFLWSILLRICMFVGSRSGPEVGEMKVREFTAVFIGDWPATLYTNSRLNKNTNLSFFEVPPNSAALSHRILYFVFLIIDRNTLKFKIKRIATPTFLFWFFFCSF